MAAYSVYGWPDPRRAPSPQRAALGRHCHPHSPPTYRTIRHTAGVGRARAPHCTPLHPEHVSEVSVVAKHNHQLTTTQRGLGWTHQARRARLLPQAWHTPCPRCGRLMLPGQDLDLDHTELPRALGGRPGTGRMAHRHCNRSHGAKLGNALRSMNRTKPKRISSRRW